MLASSLGLMPSGFPIFFAENEGSERERVLPNVSELVTETWGLSMESESILSRYSFLEEDVSGDFV